MRTNLAESVYSIILFPKHDMVLYGTEKGGQRATQRRKRETECCCERAMAWAINLTVGTNIFDS